MVETGCLWFIQDRKGLDWVRDRGLLRDGKLNIGGGFRT